MLPEHFVSNLQKHIATCYGDRNVSTLFYGQTMYPRRSTSGSYARWQAAVLESEGNGEQHDLHFYMGEIDEYSGAFGRCVPYMAPLAISGLDPEHNAFINANGSVEVFLGNEMLARTIAR